MQKLFEVSARATAAAEVVELASKPIFVGGLTSLDPNSNWTGSGDGLRMESLDKRSDSGRAQGSRCQVEGA